MEVATTIIPGYKYIVWGGSVTYNSVPIPVGGMFYGVSGVTTYSGAGFASEIIELNGTAFEVVNEPCDNCFPEKLALNAAAIEVTPPQNGTIYPEQLRIYSSAIEVVSKKTNSALIIYSIN